MCVRATGVGPSIWSQIGVGVVVTGAFWLGLETGRGGESRESLVCACAERLKERVIRLKEKREE
jgi:hypothetical protein